MSRGICDEAFAIEVFFVVLLGCGSFALVSQRPNQAIFLSFRVFCVLKSPFLQMSGQTAGVAVCVAMFFFLLSSARQLICGGLE